MPVCTVLSKYYQIKRGCFLCCIVLTFFFSLYFITILKILWQKVVRQCVFLVARKIFWSDLFCFFFDVEYGAVFEKKMRRKAGNKYQRITVFLCNITSISFLTSTAYSSLLSYSSYSQPFWEMFCCHCLLWSLHYHCFLLEWCKLRG